MTEASTLADILDALPPVGGATVPGRLPDPEYPRVIEGMSNAAYHSRPEASSTKLKVLANTTPLHFWHRFLSGEYEEARKDDFVIGSLFHAVCLPGEDPDTDFVMGPDCERRKDADKAIWAAAEADALATGRDLIKPEWMELAVAMAGAVAKHPTAAMILGMEGRAETSLLWRDQETGVALRCRPDWLVIGDDTALIVDLKSIRDGSPEGFQRASINHGYDVQAYLYSEGVKAALGKEVEAFVFLCVEKTPPYAVSLYRADTSLMELGYRKARKALALYAECTKTGIWPGYPEDIIPLSAPAWEIKKMENEDE